MIKNKKIMEMIHHFFQKIFHQLNKTHHFLKIKLTQFLIIFHFYLQLQLIIIQNHKALLKRLNLNKNRIKI